MRIAHVLSTPAGIGGAEALVASLARHSQDRGDDVVVLNIYESAEMGSALVTACAPVPVRSQGSGPTAVVAARRFLRAQLAAHQPDVVHVHLARALLAVAQLPRVQGRALLLTHHHGDLFLREGRGLAAAAERLHARRYDAVAAVSPAVAAVLVDRLGYPADRVHVVTNGWTGVPLPRQLRPPLRLLCIGRLRREKGHDVLLHAFQEVVRAHPGAVLDLVGDGPERQRLERLVAELDLAKQVVFHGDVPDVWPCLSRAHLAVQPSLVEALGITALEAMAAGVPLVASSTGGLVDVVEPGRSGILVPPGDAAALGSALLHLLDDPALAAQLAERGRVRAEQFRADRTLAAYDELYETLVRRTKDGG